MVNFDTPHQKNKGEPHDGERVCGTDYSKISPFSHVAGVYFVNGVMISDKKY